MEKEKTDKKDHILDVAEKVFSEVGYDGASTRMISGEAGVNMAMLNYYFGSKEGLFLAIFERRISMFRDMLRDIGNTSGLSPWGKIEKYIETYVDRIFNNTCFQRMLYQEISMSRKGDLPDKINQILTQNVSEFNKLIKEGVDTGDFKPDTDIEMITATIFGIKNYLMNTPYVSSKMFGYDIQNEESLKIFKPRLKAYLINLLKPYLLK
ncbi:TetR/AcrR family transcriptional regulator [Mucilaginibacter sp. KACC 22063]|uniref:TetR/AcrR family transcriptional regulator n=1 Tax=Mucilaginibacter sp. KACC 22063 TaxID=3025666 RepID=UPI002365F1FE|nr:TetR/AcrR family transcriptional regulator [Mucilaginibacter sp. KACC 22063]WDF55298.1 TetR/AcrR family transcriptional regulator [Mucilaginibacter sp. KACC 22063]